MRMAFSEKDFVFLLVAAFVSAAIIGVICACLDCMRLCPTTKSNVRTSTQEERSETEATAGLFDRSATETDVAVNNQYLTATVHHAMQDIMTAITNEVQPDSTLGQHPEDLYHRIQESMSYLVQNIENGVPRVTFCRRGQDVSPASSEPEHDTPQAAGGGSSSLVRRETNEVPLESIDGGTKEPHETFVGNAYRSSGNFEFMSGSTTGTCAQGSWVGTAEIGTCRSADARGTDESPVYQGVDVSVQKAVRDYFNRPTRDILQGYTSSPDAEVNTDPSLDDYQAVRGYLTRIIDVISLQWLNEQTTESASDNEYTIMHNCVATPKDTCQYNLNSERKILERPLPDTSLLASRLSAIRKLPFTIGSRKRSSNDASRCLYANVKGFVKRH
ncbi:uncharacterized protein [Haliotis cracherodii]|uniref:uncharacterized protein n=1 Tax=Haliotis cracherodii TaxID=6455 RepID=UPI0039EBBD80